MRTFWLFVLAACSSPAPSPANPRGSATAAPGTGSDASGGAQPHASSAARLASAATLIVIGEAMDRATLDGHVGSIAVTRILKGSCDANISFESEPVAISPGPAIYYLRAETAERFRVLPASQRSLGDDPAAEADVIAALRDVVAPDPAPAFAQDLATFRAAAGVQWSPAMRPAVDAARRIFSGISWIGMTHARVESALGKPDEIVAHRWRYIRHTGEQGVIRELRFGKDVVEAVDIQLTQ